MNLWPTRSLKCTKHLEIQTDPLPVATAAWKLTLLNAEAAKAKWSLTHQVMENLANAFNGTFHTFPDCPHCGERHFYNSSDINVRQESKSSRAAWPSRASLALPAVNLKGCNSERTAHSASGHSPVHGAPVRLDSCVGNEGVTDFGSAVASSQTLSTGQGA